MRRTEQEFKAELIRRTEQFRAVQRRRRKQLLTAALGLLLVTGGWRVVFLAGGDGYATDMMAESPMEMMSANSSMMDKSEPECAPGAAVEEDVEDGAGFGIAGIDDGYAVSGSEGKCYYVTSVEVHTVPESETHSGLFTDEERIAPILTAIEAFCSAEEGVEIPEWTGMVYEITVTTQSGSECYTLMGEYLFSETEGWVRRDPKAAKALMDAITQ